jgi:hypothetical protein
MVEVAYLSSTGEVKVPLKIRVKMGLKAGEKFNVGTDGGNLVFERQGLPSTEQVKEFVAWAKSHPKTRPQKIQLTAKTNGARKKRATRRRR